MKIDDILVNSAKSNMVQFDLEAFKRDYPSLYKTFVSAALEVAEKAFNEGGRGQDWTGEQWITITTFEDFKKEIL